MCLADPSYFLLGQRIKKEGEGFLLMFCFVGIFLGSGDAKDIP